MSKSIALEIHDEQLFGAGKPTSTGKSTLIGFEQGRFTATDPETGKTYRFRTAVQVYREKEVEEKAHKISALVIE